MPRKKHSTMGKKRNRASRKGYGKTYRREDNIREELPERLPPEKGCRRFMVYVEGYEDVAFWRGVFDDFESDDFTFEISVPLRDDLAKGKKVVLRMAEKPQPDDSLYCIDSDIDYLFANQTSMSQLINHTPQRFHTYAYATENYLCYAPSLHNICVKATKNDTKIFDFEKFFEDYSRIIYPLFVWYAYSAQIATPNVFTLIDFKSSVKLNYLEVDNNGADTLEWLHRQVERRLASLRRQHPDMENAFPQFESMLVDRGVRPENTYLFMQGHTLMDNVVMPVLQAVCDKLRYMSITRINGSSRHGVALINEQSNYNNALQDVRNALMFNENYKDSFLYRKLKHDIEKYLTTLKRNGHGRWDTIKWPEEGFSTGL